MKIDSLPLWALTEIIKSDGPVKVDGEWFDEQDIAEYFDKKYSDESFQGVYIEPGNLRISWNKSRT